MIARVAQPVPTIWLNRLNDDLHTLATLTGVVVPPEQRRTGGREKKMIIILN